MRRTTPIAHILYAHLFPSPTPKDPTTFSHHLARDLVPEVRIEVATFYGDLNTTEARYPGLDYCYPPHRMRLSRFKHHARLFAAFDALRLTNQELQDFCCWEGTKWARERYERDEGVTVPDTTGDNIPQFVDRRLRRKARCEAGAEMEGTITRKTDIEVMLETGADADADQEMPDDDVSEKDELEEDLQTSPSPSARILALWEAGGQLPPDLEQYLKEQCEHDGWTGRSFDLRAMMAADNAAVGGARAAAT